MSAVPVVILCSPLPAPPMWEQHPVRPAGAKSSASTAHAGNHNSIGPCPRTEVIPFPKPNAVVLPYAQLWAL